MESPVIITGESPTGLEVPWNRFADVTVFPTVGGFPPGDPTGAEFTVYSLRNGLAGGAFEVVALPGEDGFSSAVVWERLPWDTEVLGLPCARIHFLGGSDCASILEYWRERAAGLGVRYVTFRVAGYITCMVPSVDCARMGVLDMIAVRSDARRKGYARSLLFGALRYFREIGFREAGQGVYDQNHATRAMYAGLGFVEFNAAVTCRLTP